MRTKFLSIIMFLFALTFVFSGCEQYSYGHVHSFLITNTDEKYLKTPANCTNKAVYYYSCSCGEHGETTFEFGEALGHDFGEWIITTKPTCTATGVETRYCSRDNTHTETRIVSKKDHNFVDGVCNSCGIGEYTEGLEYSSDGNSYKVIGKGTAESSNIILPNIYNGKPVTGIGSFAFCNCGSLTSIKIPDSVTSIGNCAFFSCSRLTSITIPDSVTSIGQGVFENCNNLQYNEYDNGLYLGNTNNPYVVLIKAKSQNVTSCIIHSDTKVVCDSAFYNCSSLTSIIIPDSVTSIGNDAFSGCSSLKSATIGNGVTIIGKQAFNGCSSLTSITIPDSVTSIESGAFSGCSSLVSISIPFVGAEAVGTSSDIDQYLFGYIFGTSEFTGGTATEQLYAENSYGARRIITFYIPSTLKSVIVTGGSSIGRYAFSNCNSLTSIKIPDSVTSIGECAFSGCSSLVSITIPDSVTSIEYEAFSGCSSLVSITIPFVGATLNGTSDTYFGYIFESGFYHENSYVPTSLKTVIITGSNYIDDRAFSNCSGLTSITIPDSVTSIGNSAFSNCSGLTSITIPDSVTSIGNSAFYCCSSLTSISIGNNVTSIGSSAFSNCSGLTSITIPDSVTSIGSYAFGECSGLTSISIGNSVTSIGSGAFSGCSCAIIWGNNPCIETIGSYSFCGYKGSSITIPNSVTSIEHKAFSDCPSLESITIPFVGGSKSETDASSSTLFGYIFGTGSYAGGTSTKQYSSVSYPIYYIPSMLKSVTVTGGNILYGAFSNCSGLTSITIGNNVTSIGDRAFDNCSGLTSITIGNNVTSIGSSAFTNCSGLTSIAIGNNVTSIGNYAFYNCSSLENITFPDSVTSIGDSAFDNCSGLTNISVSENSELEFIGVGNDGYIDKFSAYDGNYINKICVASSTTVSGKLVIKEGTTQIYSNALNNCSYLTEIYLPNSLKYCNAGALSGCSSLNKITIPARSLNGVTFGALFGTSAYSGGNVTRQNKNTYYVPSALRTIVFTGDGSISDYVLSNMTEITSVDLGEIKIISDYALSGCKSLSSITMCDAVTQIGSYAFQNCSGFNSLVLPDSVSRVDAYAFSGMTGLKNVTLGENITAISDNMFQGLINLTALTFRGTVTSIGSYAFDGCTGLTTFTIPSTVNSVGTYAFNGCSSLNSVTIGENVSALNDYVFSGCTKLMNVSFAAGSKLDLVKQYAFKNCSSITGITLPDSVTKIEDYGFANATGLTNIFLSDNLIGIGKFAFKGCSKLATVKFGTKLNTIDENAFENCTNLQSLVLPSYVTSIGANAFKNCNGLRTLDLRQASELLSIGSSAFENASQLLVLVIPDKVESIGNNAFKGCTSLNSLQLGKGLKSIGQYAFSGSKIVSLTISDNIDAIGDYAFYNCKNIASLTIGNNIKSLGNSAFEGNIALDTITFGNGINEISNYTFKGCTSLRKVTFNGAVSQLGKGAFYGCTKLENADLEYVTNIGAEAFYNCGKLKNINISSAVELGVDAFYACSALTYIEIPDTITTIGARAFMNCTKLNNIMLSEGIISIGERAFYGCSSISSLKIPDSVVNFGSEVFASSGINSVYIGNNVTAIGNKMFKNCSSLEYVFGAENALSIGDEAFSGCENLKEYTIPSNVTSLGKKVFYNCSSLENLVLPEGLTIIDSDSLLGLSALKELTVPSSVMTLTEGVFKGLSGLKEITIPYVGTDVWQASNTRMSVFGVIFGSSAYNDAVACTQEYDVGATATYYIPKGLERIIVKNTSDLPYGAFSGLTTVKEIEIDSTVTDIDAAVFKGASSLSLVYFRDSEDTWDLVNKDENYNQGAPDYELRFVPNNLVRVFAYDKDGVKLNGFTATLKQGDTVKYTSYTTWFGVGMDNVYDGSYILTVNYGDNSADLEVVVDGDERFTVVVDKETSVPSSDEELLTTFSDREMIVILNWGIAPRDLDSHMNYTDNESSYHIYYEHMIDTATGTNLDVDDVSSYGPEVVTVKEVKDGIYRYSVYDYTHRDSNSSNGLITSNAVVRLYIDGVLVRTYEVPTTGLGCLWSVFEYNGATNEITDINTISGGITSANVR